MNISGRSNSIKLMGLTSKNDGNKRKKYSENYCHLFGMNSILNLNSFSLPSGKENVSIFELTEDDMKQIFIDLFQLNEGNKIQLFCLNKLKIFK